jgi:hypothetical protein
MTPSLRSLVSEAEALLEQHVSARTCAEWQADVDALIAEMSLGANRASECYQRILRIPEPDPSTCPPSAPRYREMTPAEVHIGMLTGYEAGLDEAVDREIGAWQAHGTLPESVAGLEALAKLIGVRL